MGKRGVGRPPKKKVVVQEQTIVTQAIMDSVGETTAKRSEEGRKKMMNQGEVVIDNPKVIVVDSLNTENPDSTRDNTKEVVKSPIRVSPTKTWVDVIQGNRDIKRGMALRYIPPTMINGEVEISIEDKDVVNELNYWESAMILFAMGESLSMNAIKKFMEKVWNFFSLPELYYNDTGYFIVRFKLDEDRERVMQQGPYFIYGAPLFLRYWSAEFEIRDDLFKVVPIWITLPQLPLYLWGDESISKIASVIGCPVTTDECTARKLRISYARILVEVDITPKTKESIWIRDQTGRRIEKKIEYEWRPRYCQTCLRVGHDCSLKKNQIKKKGVET
ncbi:uncharacterized protein LOC131619069 [Vicia villosa]|uniref:uncharacterized protein LOC131619069 n=1 Tax=Vicia villosa TaxID=3911 RepID=UPI00273B78E8|nr:uncharacterized protein LOC131619069 [Vicia villosa]